MHAFWGLKCSQGKIIAERLSSHAFTQLVNGSDVEALRPMAQGFQPMVPAAAWP